MYKFMLAVNRVLSDSFEETVVSGSEWPYFLSRGDGRFFGLQVGCAKSVNAFLPPLRILDHKFSDGTIYPTVTGMSVIVSLPNISITFTATT